MRKRPRVVLVGEGITTMSALKSLLVDCEVAGLIRSGTGEDSTVAAARVHGVAVFRDASLAGLRAVVGELQPDIVVVSSYNRIIPASLLAERPWINVHYAPLPRYRGRATVNWAIINGEAETAITIHCMVPELDAGNILFQAPVRIGPPDTVTGLYHTLNAIQYEQLGMAVLRRQAGDAGFPQDESKASYSCTRLPEDGEIDWNTPAVEIDRLVRALTYPFPGAYTWLSGRRLGIRAAQILDGPPYEGRIPGRVVALNKSTGSVDVLAGKGIVRLMSVDHSGSVRPPAEIIRSTKTTLGGRQDKDLQEMEQQLRAAGQRAGGLPASEPNAPLYIHNVGRH